eukprot:COSAG01_NODE_6_length_54687_cov_500.907599_39_plen_857_part_00
MELPKKYKHQDISQHWIKAWAENGLYSWDKQSDNPPFVIDTPPPTVSGSLHIGHVFSYTQTDVIARYQRMRGKNVCYPMGWDDNGLPTERRVQQVFGISCDPTLPYDSDWQPKEVNPKKHKHNQPISRQNFIEACLKLTQQDEKAFEDLWRQLGLSVDWKLTYSTISPACQALSQRSFLDLQAKGLVYSKEAPGMWDIDFQTAVAQAECEDREDAGAYHHINFETTNGEAMTIATTRPELLPACIAVVAHPDDERYKPLFGKTAITPLFGAEVPILPAEHADPEKGTGILMVCTFGDAMDVAWWQHSDLALKQVLGRNGCFQALDFSSDLFKSRNPEQAQAAYSHIQGKRCKQAKRIMADLLAQPGSAVSGDDAAAMPTQPEPITHPVKYFEKGDSPLEFIPTRQWYINLLDHKEDLLKQGDKVTWQPNYMQSRYSNWVEGLNQDWCVSRQRFFGVPFPLWYPLDEQGNPKHDTPIFAKPEQCPIDPMTAIPEGYTVGQRNQPLGFCAEADVMDTWATSSLTPQIISGWPENKTQHKQLFPFDLRPQSHEIIRTWAFYTIAKAWFHNQDIPWKRIAISGWILDPDRKKMSKSKGNVVTPQHLLDEYSADAIRYWASKARLGVDTAFDESVFLIGKKVLTKLFNASKFVMMQIADAPDTLSEKDLSETIDLSFWAQVQSSFKSYHEKFEAFEYAAALEEVENLFWAFCDHYIELVKTRAYKATDPKQKASAQAGLKFSLSVICQGFAPFMPFLTEQIWQCLAKQDKSVHSSMFKDIAHTTNSPEAFHLAVDVLSQVRAYKSKEQISIKVPVNIAVSCNQDQAASLNLVIEDLKLAGHIDYLEILIADQATLEVSVSQ